MINMLTKDFQSVALMAVQAVVHCPLIGDNSTCRERYDPFHNTLKRRAVVTDQSNADWLTKVVTLRAIMLLSSRVYTSMKSA